MANLTFPSNPTNGQKVTLGDKVFVYSNTTSRWTATKLNVFGNLTGDFTIAPPELSLSNNTVAFSTTGETVYITYTVDQDIKATIANNGIANSSYANVTLHQTNNTIQITAGTEAFSGANVVLTVTNTRTSNTASINLSASYIDWTSPTQQARIKASNEGSDDYFGYSVAISANTIIVGAYLEDATNQGAGYCFRKTSTSWNQTQLIRASDKANDDYFGVSVDIDGNYAVFGADREDASAPNAGSVYIFRRSTAVGSFTQQQKIQASNAGDGDFFGGSVAISANTIIVGARQEDSTAVNSGSAYFFTRSGSTWSQQQRIQSSDIESVDNFGFSVDIDGDTAIVGAPYEDTGGGNAGSAYIFTRSGSTWTQQAKIQPTGVASSDAFGHSVAIDGDTVIVGAYYDDSGRGSATVFTRSGSTWTQQARLTASDRSASDYFGWSVDIDGDVAVVGAKQENSSRGQIYIYTRSGSTWTEAHKTRGTGSVNGDMFGTSVAIEGAYVVSGAPEANTNAGAVHVFYAG